MFRVLFSAANASYSSARLNKGEIKAYHGLLQVGKSIDVLLMSIFCELDLVGFSEVGSSKIGSLLVYKIS